jgi:hypothetical protein
VEKTVSGGGEFGTIIARDEARRHGGTEVDIKDCGTPTVIDAN